MLRPSSQYGYWALGAGGDIVGRYYGAYDGEFGEYDGELGL